MRHSIAVVLAAAVVASGCGSSGGDSKMVRTGKPVVQVKPDGKLSANPAPLTLADVQKQPKDSAEKAMFELLFWAEWGSWPNVVDGYDPSIVASLGLDDITGAYSVLRPQLVAAQPRLLSALRRDGRVAVQIELLTTTSAPMRESFLLRKTDGRWRIVSDTLLERGLVAYVQQRTETDPNAAKASPRGARAGLQAGARYRSAFATEVLLQGQKRRAGR